MGSSIFKQGGFYSVVFFYRQRGRQGTPPNKNGRESQCYQSGFLLNKVEFPGHGAQVDTAESR